MKKIKITESQYNRIFLSEDENEETHPCLEDHKRLHYIKKDLIKNRKFPEDGMSLNPPKWGDYDCVLQSKLKSGNTTIKWIFIEHPHLFYLYIENKTDGFNFNFKEKFPELSEITRIVLGGDYSLTGDFRSGLRVDTRQVDLFSFDDMDNQRHEGIDGEDITFWNLSITEILKLIGATIKRDDGGSDGSFLPKATAKVMELVDEWEEVIGDEYQISENNIADGMDILNELNGDCDGLKNFLLFYQKKWGESPLKNLASASGSMWSPKEEYQKFRKTMLEILDYPFGSRESCPPPQLWDKLEEHIEWEKING